MPNEMTDSERISKWLGLTPCDDWVITNIGKGEYGKGDCNCKDCIPESLYPREFDKYPEWWTPALYQKIEDAGIHRQFAKHLENQCTVLGEKSEYGIHHVYFRIASSKPEHKTTALSRALQEMESKE